MRWNKYLRRFGFKARDERLGDSGGPASRPSRRMPGTEVLGLVALFGAIDAPEALRLAADRARVATTAREVEKPSTGTSCVAFVRSTFAIHWEPIDRDAALHRDFDLSDGWVRIPLDRSAT
ncbi:hypothetical protein [Tautonia sociabilis]|uniref:Uncharacterized protein n=1 Tax=Tautonia sociabilis TaxID=2080755 RepID=A0A432MLX0_9BACT|nr:hypothetical protein [Tautonia sociabilis]RUL88197.1 hypothetical protein TsocGM_08655 [Tautonia sociabilis]